MFFLFLLGLLVAGFVHGKVFLSYKGPKLAELILVYLLAGYCGITMVAVTVAGIVSPSFAASMVGTEPGNPFQDFFLVAYMGMSIMALLCIWVRGTYLIANVICWGIYWLGATYIHMIDFHQAGNLSFNLGLAVFGAHGFVTVLLVIVLILSFRGSTEPVLAKQED